MATAFESNRALGFWRAAEAQIDEYPTDPQLDALIAHTVDYPDRGSRAVDTQEAINRGRWANFLAGTEGGGMVHLNGATPPRTRRMLAFVGLEEVERPGGRMRRDDLEGSVRQLFTEEPVERVYNTGV